MPHTTHTHTHAHTHAPPPHGPLDGLTPSFFIVLAIAVTIVLCFMKLIVEPFMRKEFVNSPRRLPPYLRVVK